MVLALLLVQLVNNFFKFKKKNIWFIYMNLKKNWKLLALYYTDTNATQYVCVPCYLSCLTCYDNTIGSDRCLTCTSSYQYFT